MKAKIKIAVLNGENVIKLPVELVSLKVFKENYNQSKCKKCYTDKLISCVSDIKKIEYAGGIVEYEIHVNDGSKITINSKGKCSRTDKNGKLYKDITRKKVCYRKEKIAGLTFSIPYGTHIVAKIRAFGNCDITLERLIYIADAIHNDAIPLSMKGVAVNCKNLCGNTNNAYGIRYDINPNKLEICTSKQNLRHAYLVKRIYQITEKVYAISARDCFIEYFLDAEYSKDFLEWYIKLAGYSIVKCKKNADS